MAASKLFKRTVVDLSIHFILKHYEASGLFLKQFCPCKNFCRHFWETRIYRLVALKKRRWMNQMYKSKRKTHWIICYQTFRLCYQICGNFKFTNNVCSSIIEAPRRFLMQIRNLFKEKMTKSSVTFELKQFKSKSTVARLSNTLWT